MAAWNVYIPCWGDFEFLRGAVESLPPEPTVYVVDGRYADFPGDTLRTPGLEDWCSEQPSVEYYSPADDRLPWGHEHASDEPHLRHPGYEQAKYANYEVLPQDEWVLHVDADERLRRFDADLKALPRSHKFVPYIDSLAERGIGVPRLYVPGWWTFWIGGVFYPREYWDRGTPIEKLAELHAMSMTHQYINRGELLDDIRIHNVGSERPREYHEARARQLEAMGRVDRARDYREQRYL